MIGNYRLLRLNQVHYFGYGKEKLTHPILEAQHPGGAVL